jgi:hypothetical protein
MEAEMSNDSRTVQARTDFYTVVHKALRKRLFEVVVLAGATDFASADDRSRLAGPLAEVVRALREHAEHEGEFLHPVIADVMPDLALSLDAEHVAHHRALDGVERVFEVAFGERTPTAGHRAYRVLAHMAGEFLAHIEQEEAMQPRVWDLADEQRLAAAMAAFKKSRTLDQTLAGWRHMLPAMTATERTAMFQALHGAAPEAVVAAAERLAEHVLDRREWSVLTASLA